MHDLVDFVEKIVQRKPSLRPKKLRLLRIIQSIEKNYKDVAKQLSLRSPTLLEPMLLGEVRIDKRDKIYMEISMLEGKKLYSYNTIVPVTIRVTLDGEKTTVEAKTSGKRYKEIMNNELHVVCKKLKF